MRLSRTGLAVSVLPSLLMLGLFYSLAIHMRQSLGAWPSSIGDRGFPASLVAHETVTVYFCIAFVAVSVFVVPIAILVCLFVPRWRRFVPYFALYVLLFGICWGLMQFAPEQFLYWWRD
jgi:hypothetical protein